jgi:hypothetical protein
MKRFNTGLVLVAAVVAVACGDTTGFEGGGTIGIRFATAASAPALDLSASAALDLDGTNGRLTLDDVRLIIREFEVDRVDDDCGDDASSGADDGSPDGDDDDCEKFRAPPAFISLPLEGAGALVVEQPVPPGVYDEIELEIEEIGDDDDVESLRDRQARDLMIDVRRQFPEWPREASIRVEGTFTPESGSPRPFVAYFDAEIEFEVGIRPPLVIGEGDDPIVTLDVDPGLWFRTADGAVLDLSAFDFATTGRVAEFEIEVEKGFVRARFED